MNQLEFHIIPKRFLPALLCLCLLPILATSYVFADNDILVESTTSTPSHLSITASIDSGAPLAASSLSLSYDMALVTIDQCTISSDLLGECHITASENMLNGSLILPAPAVGNIDLFTVEFSCTPETESFEITISSTKMLDEQGDSIGHFSVTETIDCALQTPTAIQLTAANSPSYWTIEKITFLMSLVILSVATVCLNHRKVRYLSLMLPLTFLLANVSHTPVAAQQSTLLGDVSCDSRVDIIDALYIYQYTQGQRAASSACTLPVNSLLVDNCDLSGDGVCDIADTQAILVCDVTVEHCGESTIDQYLVQAISSEIEANSLALHLDSIDLAPHSLSLLLSAETLVAEDLIDSFEFQELFGRIDIIVSNILEEENYVTDTVFVYELFLNDILLVAPSNNSNRTSSVPRQPATNEQRIVIGPGHGYFFNGNGWSLDRPEIDGVREDFINAELAIELYGKLQQSGKDVWATREMDVNTGNHPTSGFPWWQMGASEYAKHQGASDFVWGAGYAPHKLNIVAPPRYANSIGGDILINIHNNAFSNSSACGTETWYDTNNGYSEESRQLAILIQNKLIERIRTQWNPNWCDRKVKGSNGGYGENRIFNGAAVIVELGFITNPSDRAALKDDAFRTIAISAIHDAILEYQGNGSTTPPPTVFSGQPRSRLFIDQNNERINLEVCAGNLTGQTLHAQLSRANRTWPVQTVVANSGCFTFWDMDGDGPILPNEIYETRVALNQAPNLNWNIPCFASTGGRGLCDSVSFQEASGSEFIYPVQDIGRQWTITQGYNTGYHGGNHNNSADKMTLDFAEIDPNYANPNPNISLGSNIIAAATGDVWSVGDCHIVIRHGDVFTSYLHVVPVLDLVEGQSVTIGQKIGTIQLCGGIATGAHVHFMLNRWAANSTPPREFPFQSHWEALPFLNLCGVSYPFNGQVNQHKGAIVTPCNSTAPPPTNPTTFQGNPSSRLFFDQNGARINLEVCADNLPGQSVHAQLFRLGKTFAIVTQQASGRCVTFWDMDGAGDVLYDTTYTTRAALNQAPNTGWPIPCFSATAGQGLCDHATFASPSSTGFTGNPSSRLFFDQNGARINLEVCADNLPGQSVRAQLSRPGRIWSVVSQHATGRCVTFWDMDGAGDVLYDTTYTTRAALNQSPNTGWSIPCFSTTGGQGLCDQASLSSPATTVFAGNPSSRLFFDQNGARINLEVCADNLPGQSVRAQLSRPGKTFSTVAQQASGRCVTFWDMDGAGNVLYDTNYQTRAALNQNPNPNWSIPCFSATNGQGLCDQASLSSPAPTTFSGNPYSRLFFDQNGARINLEVCADNLPGQSVRAQLSRPGKTFSTVAQQASGRCVTFWDMDGAGNVLYDTNYQTRASLNQNPNRNWSIPCFSATGGQGLCDQASISSPNPTVFSGNPYSRLFFDQNGARINLEVCADNLPGQSVRVQLTRPGRIWPVVSQQAGGRCVTFWDLDGAGGVLHNTTYTTRAALNQNPNLNWSIPCFSATGGQGLCDQAQY